MLNYQIALTNVVFDNSYKNVLRFENRSEQEAYFNINTLFLDSTNVNFNVGSLFATNVIYDGKEEADISELLNKNYCIVKNNNENATIKYFYYFITNSMQDCGNRLKLSLELDIFQTYYIDLKFSDSIIYKAHLNRFVQSETDPELVEFDGSVDSKLFEREDVKNVSKRMKRRECLNIYKNNKKDLSEWFKEHVLGWMYFYAPAGQKYHISTEEEPINRNLLIRNFENKGGIFNPFSVIAIPVLSSGANIRILGDNSEYKYEINTLSVETFINQNSTDKFYSVKFSTTPPFESIEPYEYSINGNTLTIQSKYSYDYETRFSIDGGTANIYARKNLFVLETQNPSIKIGFSTQDAFVFNKIDIIDSAKNPVFNPKLLNADYKSLRVSDSTENGFDYDIQKLNTNNFTIGITEPFTPDLQKKYIRLMDLTGVYTKEYAENLVGFISQNDTSIALTTDLYKQMLAYNKNYFIQNDTNRGLDLVGGVTNTLFGNLAKAFTGNPIGATTGVLTQGTATAIDYTRSKITEELTIDNLKSAPHLVTSAKGNSYFENMYSENGIIVEEWDILPNEKEMINDYMCKYGFTYNRIDNIKNVDNIRKYYNFVQAEIETINGINVSDIIHKKFRECFANGVRFWNVDTFNYDKENFERWLENE